MFEVYFLHYGPLGVTRGPIGLFTSREAAERCLAQRQAAAQENPADFANVRYHLRPTDQNR